MVNSHLLCLLSYRSFLFINYFYLSRSFYFDLANSKHDAIKAIKNLKSKEEPKNKLSSRDNNKPAKLTRTL